MRRFPPSPYRDKAMIGAWRKGWLAYSSGAKSPYQTTIITSSGVAEVARKQHMAWEEGRDAAKAKEKKRGR
jgi:hypothetical protein